MSAAPAAAFEGRTRLAAGLLWTVACDRAHAEAAEERILDAFEKRAEFISVAGTEAYVKASSMGTWTALRHGLAHALARRAPPRMREFANLLWLREHDFVVPLPLVAMTLSRRGLPRYQALLTKRVPRCRTLEEFLEAERSSETRESVLAEIAGELARMHTLGFVHHDFFARNVLVREERPGEGLVVFLDAWAGGPGGGLGGFAYDLACFFLDASELLEEDEQAAFLDAYFARRAEQGRPAQRAGLLDSARRKRARLRARLLREPRRLRGRELPRAECAALRP